MNVVCLLFIMFDFNLLGISTSNKSYNLINTNLNKEKDKSEEINNINSQIHNTNITPRLSSG